MEAAVLSFVLNTLAPKIFAFLQENHDLRGNLELDIQSIRNELGMIAAAIEDHHRRSWRWSDGTNDAEKFWIQSVRDLAYSMQDCMDRFLPKGGELKTMSMRTKWKFAKKIGKLKKKSLEVSRLRENYTSGCQASTSGASPPTSEVPEQHPPAADLVGIDVPRDELLELMREDEGKPKQLKVISIVGLGGIGKTVLARQVYHSVTVREEYEPRVWVPASEKGAGDVLSEILRQVQVGRRVHDGYCDNLSKCLRFKRFLIVIDDMRTEYWNTIKNAFPKNMAVSSRVIVTTAIRSIAKACSADNGHMYVMRTLDEEHSKRLFFKEASSEYLCDGLPLAEQVLKKCDGLPLALVTTAQLLQSKCLLTPKGCADLCRDLGERVEKEETLARMKHALLQSYYSLPGHVLKVLLLYLGIFPSGRPVRRKCLIRRWLAEGFVEADHRRSAPDVAIENFNELMDRSVIQHVDMSNNTEEAKTCQTHGMVLEFILQKSMCENFITLLYDQARLPDKIRWLSLHHNGAADRLKTDIDFSLVRSLTIFGKADEHVLKFSKYKLLRVLDLEECETLNDKHVKNICNLWRLKYLSLGVNITKLPKEISKLEFLETLDVKSASVKNLPIPIEVIKLPCLIHLLGEFSFPDVGKEMKELQTFLSEKSNLETLAGFVADQSPAFPQLMSHMNSLKKVKVWCKPTADGSNSFTHLSRPLQEFIQRDTKVMDRRSLSLSFEGCSQDFLDFRHEDNCCYLSLSLSSLKLHGELQRLPLFVTKLGSVTELCLSSPDQLSGHVLAALSKVRGLHYLKLITRQIDRFVIKQGELKNLQHLCIVVQSMACLEIQEGALPQLESLWLLCKGLNGLCGAEIEHLARLKEVALDDGVSEKTKEEWKEAAKKHLKRPRVSLLGRKDVDQNRMQMGVGSEPREVSESRAAPSPEVADIQTSHTDKADAQEEGNTTEHALSDYGNENRDTITEGGAREGRHGDDAEAMSGLDALTDTIEASTDPELCRDLHTRMHSMSLGEHVQDDPHRNYVPTDVEQVQGNVSTTDDPLGPVLLRPCTQEDNLLPAPVPRRSNRLTRVPELYVSPFKGNFNRPKIPMTKACSLRQKFCKTLNSSSDVFISAGSNVFKGTEIFDSFGNEKMLSSKFMATYVSFITHDEEAHMPDGGRHRVFLSQELGELLNTKEHERNMEFPYQVAQGVLQRDLLGVAPHKVKLYFLPVLENGEWSVYCLNMMHTRIDVFDSTAVDHEVVGARIVPRLNDLFQKVTNGGVKEFVRWRRPIIRDVPKQLRENDSGFFATKFMDLWNGDGFETPIIRGRDTPFRAEVLFYMLYHPLNEIKKLPGGLETHRPRP